MCNIFKESFHKLWFARELCTQFRILSCHTNWTGIKVTDSHHYATRNHERRCSKSKLFCSKQSCNYNIAARFHLAVCLHGNAAAQFVEHQRLLCFRQPQFPRRSSVFERIERACPRSSVVATDQNDVGKCLGYACRHGTDALMYTVPVVTYGVFRYLYLVHQREQGGSPSDLLLNDRPLLACVTLWVVAVVLMFLRSWRATLIAGVSLPLSA